MYRNHMTWRQRATASAAGVEVASHPGRAGGVLPMRTVGRSVSPEPDRPVVTTDGPVLLHAVLDGLRRMNAEAAAR